MGEATVAIFNQSSFFGDILIKNLRNMMALKNVSEAKLSLFTGIPQPTLHKILTGKTADPRISTVRLLADYFGVTVDSMYSVDCVHFGQGLLQGKHIPLLTWRESLDYMNVNNANLMSSERKWVLLDDPSAKFALLSKQSMEPYFRFGTLLIIGQPSLARDGDYVIIHYENLDEVCLRRQYFNGFSFKFVKPGDEFRDKPQNDCEGVVIGSLIQARTDYINRKELS